MNALSTTAARWTLAAILLLPAAPIAAQDARSLEELANVLRMGDSIVVSVDDGRRIQGALQEVTRTALTMRTARGTEVVSADRVRQVRRKVKDRLWNGLLIGTAAGALAGLVPDYYDDCEECHDSLYASTAVGAGVGLVVDVLVRRSVVVYRAPESGAKTSLGLERRAGRTAIVLRILF